MNAEANSLPGKIESFQLDEPGAALPFTSRLAREQGWDHAFAGRVVSEYLRFIKLGVGLSRGKPVGFLIMLLFVSLILAIIAGSSARRLTKTGEELLAKLRMEKDRAPDTAGFEGVCWNLALMGPAVLAGIPAFAAMQRDLERHVGNSAAGSASGGCGSSGCGDSGSGGEGGVAAVVAVIEAHQR